MANKSRHLPAKPRVNGHRAAPQNLKRENDSLRKTVAALIERVEHELNARHQGFAIFEAAVRLEKTVRARTKKLERLNRQLTRELAARQAMEVALTAAKQQADHANQVKSRFLAAASHDLRQPLSSALLFLESLQDESLTPSNGELIGKAKIALSSLNDLLATLLDITKLEVGIEPRIGTFKIAEVLAPMVSEYSKVAAAAGLELRYVTSSATVRSDPRLLQSVLRNYISNAIRYTHHGRVIIGCRRRHAALEIIVQDTGIGISSDQLEKIFEAYHQIAADAASSRREMGMGLGLSIVDRIVRILGLERRVRSNPGCGSRFSVLVPYGRDVTRARSVDGVSAGRDLLSGRIVVVIDDNREVLESLSALLRKWGCVTVGGRSATDALNALVSLQLTPDLVISDYHLSGETGAEAIARIRQAVCAAAPAFLITSDPDPMLRSRLKVAGIPVLTKPLNFAKLRALMDRTLCAAPAHDMQGSALTPRHRATDAVRH